MTSPPSADPCAVSVGATGRSLLHKQREREVWCARCSPLAFSVLPLGFLPLAARCMVDAVFTAPSLQIAPAIDPDSHWRLDEGRESRPLVRQRLAMGPLIDYDL